MNKWTLALASLGLVNLSLNAQAEEAKLVPITTVLSATTISGYVDASAVWNPGTGNANPAPYAFNAGKQDGFNLDSVQIQIAKPLDESPWSAGYTVAMMFGPDAPGVTGQAFGTGLGENLRTATVDLRAPIGNGLDFHIGRFNNIIGYESTESYKNPNWSRSYAWSIEPTEHTGVLAEYRFNDSILLDVGVANSVTTLPINYRSPRAESKKAIVSLLTLTAPKSWGFLADDILYVGLDQGPGAPTEDKTHFYVGSTLNTPIKALTLGFGYDSVNHLDVGADTGYFSSIAAYASYKLTEKLTANVRGEYARGNGITALAAGNPNTPAGVVYPAHALDKVVALTGTLQYDLWANVLTRLEARWDHAATGQAAFGGTTAGTPTKKDEFLVAANVVYKF